jgi:RNA polymerase sigma-70 factor (ECF subfamily)
MSSPDVVRETIGRLRLSARRHGGQDAEDFVQEALARAVANGVPLEAVPWLRTVARNIAIDRSRRPREIAHGHAVDLERFFTEVTAGPEEHVLTAERRKAVRDALAELPERYRDALLVWADEGAAAVSRELETSPGATWTLLSRARDRLRRELEKVGVVPGVLTFRFRKWWTALAPGGLALGIAVTMTLPGPHPTVADASPAPASPHAGAARAESPDVVSRAPAAAHPAQVTAHTPAGAVPPALPKPGVPFAAQACVPQPGTSRAGVVAVWVKDDGNDSPVTSAVVNALPEQLKQTSQGGCS